MTQFRYILRLTRPVQLLFILLTYSLGMGIARYLGVTLRPVPQFAGAAILLLLLAASSLLSVYFRPFNEPLLPGTELTPREQQQLRTLLLALAAAFVGVAVVVVFFLLPAAVFPMRFALPAGGVFPPPPADLLPPAPAVH